MSKSITFDKKAQDALPKWVKDKMKKHRDEAEAKKLQHHNCANNLIYSSATTGYCTICDNYVDLLGN